MAGKHLVILGPPGSGKGTQAVRIADAIGLKHLSTGDLLREAVAGGMELGLKAGDYMSRGLLVPDGIMLGLIEEELGTLGDAGWILDGFPRTLEQAEALSAMLEEHGLKIDGVILIEVEEELVIKRLSSRLVCPNCKAVYGIDNMDAVSDGRCGDCGTELVKRPDDEEETIRRRLHVYEEQTAPVVDYYRGRGGLKKVDGAGKIDEITAEIVRVLK